MSRSNTKYFNICVIILFEMEKIIKMDSEKIGKFIAELRKENKMTQEELGKKILVDRGTISKWERGIYVPNPEILLSLSGCSSNIMFFFSSLVNLA